jgi:EpsI family protein
MSSVADAPRPRIMLDRRQLVLGGLLLATGAGTLALRRPPSDRKLTPQQFSEVTPARIGDYAYAGDDGLILPQSELSEQLYTNVRLGVYSRAGTQPIMMLVAYDDTEERNGLQMHRPEQCYRGSGFAVGKPEELEMRGPGGMAYRAVFWTATRPDREEHVLFWTRVGDQFPASPWQQNVAMMRSNLTFGAYDSALVRISTVSSDRTTALASLQRFAGEMTGSLTPLARRILFGPRVA